MNETETPSVKCVIVGDRESGKTCSLISYVNKTFLEKEDTPRVFDNYNVNVMFNHMGKQSFIVNLGLFDTTCGGKSEERLRPLSYTDADIFLVFFSLVNPSSLENVKNRWFKELKENCPEVPIILVGTKLDIREDSYYFEKPEELVLLEMRREKPVVRSKGENVARENSEEFNCVGYYEISSKTQKGVKELFENAVVHAGLEKKYPHMMKGKEKGGCLIL